MLNPKPQLLTVGADSEHRRAKDAAVPLHWAAFFGHVVNPNPSIMNPKY